MHNLFVGMLICVSQPGKNGAHVPKYTCPGFVVATSDDSVEIMWILDEGGTTIESYTRDDITDSRGQFNNIAYELIHGYVNN